MNIEIKFKYSKNKTLFDTKADSLICCPGRGYRQFGQDEMDADIIGPKGMVIGTIHTGIVDSSNKLCQEIVRRFNEFPNELKK